MNEVSAIVCTLNSKGSIKECLESLVQNDVFEIIIVDGNSSDGTPQIASRYTDKILTDPGKGLAYARNVGIAKAKGRYILNVGSDNIFPDGSIERMIQFIESSGYTGVSAVTLLHEPNMNYLSWAMNEYKKARFYPGEREVIGTPSLFRSDILKKNNFDNNMTHSDDSDLCYRLSRAGHKFAISSVHVYEMGFENMDSIIDRWARYGKSDYEFYRKYSPDWGATRKMYSITHPLRSEFIKPLISVKGLNKLRILPFLALITALRYIFWLKSWLIRKV